MTSKLSDVNASNPESLCAYFDDGPLPAFPRMAHTPEVDEMTWRYQCFAAAAISIWLADVAAAAKRNLHHGQTQAERLARSDRYTVICEVLCVDGKKLLDTLLARIARGEQVRMPSWKTNDDTTHTDEEDGNDTD